MNVDRARGDEADRATTGAPETKAIVRMIVEEVVLVYNLRLVVVVVVVVLIVRTYILGDNQGLNTHSKQFNGLTHHL